MPVVLVKIPPTPEGAPVHSPESDIAEMSPPSTMLPDAVDQLDNDDDAAAAHVGDNDDTDQDFENFQTQAQTLTMTEGDGTTVIATTIPADDNDKEPRRRRRQQQTTDAVQEIVVEAGDATATALVESTLQHSEHDESSTQSLSLRKLVGELKEAEQLHDLPHHHTASALEERILQKGRFVSPADFELLKVIGMGAFGKVLQVRSKVTEQVLAMKVISKRKLKSKQGYIENVRAERDILTRVNHPFVVTMHCSFQTREKLFILMDFLAGGELFLRIGREGIFLEKTAAFYLAEIVLALDHLHSLGIIHRDLKPENVLLGSDGHIQITDFGLAKDFGQGGFNDEEARALTICGTQEYMAPEMIARKGYGRAADFWSLGCIAYEMLNGLPPFIRKRNEGSKDLFRKIMTEKVKMPSGASANACKLLKGLLNRNVENRLGTMRSKMFEVGGVAAIKNLPFFSEIGWSNLDKKGVEPPVNLSVESEHDLKHFHDEFVNMALPKSVIEMSKDDFTPRRVESENFRGFSFIQPNFDLPERDAQQLEAYWNSAEEDGESASEVASSKCATEDIPPTEEPKKKRPPRKRKKKKPGDTNASSTPNTPAPSTMASASPPPSELGEEKIDENAEESANPAVTIEAADAPDEKSAEKITPPISMPQPTEKKDPTPLVHTNKSSLNPTTNAWKPVSTPQPRPQPASSPWETIPPASKAPPPALKAPASDWQSVGGSNSRSRTSPPVKIQSHSTPSRGANGWNTVQPSSGRSTIAHPRGPPRPRPAGKPWGNPVPPPPSDGIDASPSSDWRHHAMSPRTPRGGRPVRQQPAEPQTWPTLDNPPLNKAKDSKAQVQAPKLQGAWAARR